MKKIHALVLLLALLVVPTAIAQETAGKTSTLVRSETVEIAFASTEALQAEGWEEVEPDVWQRALDNGATAEIALGAAGHARALGRLNASIEALQGLEILDAEQELRLLELQLRREELGKVEVPTKDDTGTALCTGTAVFKHTFGWQNFAYPFAASETSFLGSSLPGSTLTRADASLCGSGLCDSDSEIDNSGFGFTVDALAGGIPTWTCSADAYGLVYISGSNIPRGCQRIAYCTTYWNC